MKAGGREHAKGTAEKVQFKRKRKGATHKKSD
jgi:hypothetical protein